ncbi:H-type small acid-soluble spore protein [Metallumcola ferriviriculae]|uniref:H-type small acid-soluble spore protein n=1 Tax=Metallumcola ferriviriculae TaxID=3039180 RepID=A0AAU0ULP8_9FIRM|nr:H-type small acid-soluble spore protein [Desulfitibacteraceae bacterium MK1]
MDTQRAKEIVTSPIMANVTLDGEAVYIEQVNDQENTARIYPLNQPDKEQEVSLNNLKEH